ncbi:MAG: hypothetical protein V4671_02090 [Armatimonadota bacterium]
MLSQNPVGAVAAVMVVGSALGVLVSFLVKGAEGLGSLLGLAFTCWVAWHLLQGTALARWYSVLTLGLGGIGGIIGGVMVLSKSVGFGILMFIAGIIHLLCTAALLSSAASDHFE